MQATGPGCVQRACGSREWGDGALIRNVRLYHATVTAVSSRIAEIPIAPLEAGSRLYRSADTIDLAQHIAIDPDPSNRDSARPVALALRTMYSSTADHRWSGFRPPRAPGSAGLYVSLDIDAIGGEVFAYLDSAASDRPRTLEAGIGQELGIEDEHFRVKSSTAYPPWTAQVFQGLIVRKRIFEYSLSAEVKCADLRRTPSGDWAGMLRELDQDQDVRAALADAGYGSVDDACLDGEDYSFTRAVGHAIHDKLPNLAALLVSSARIEEATTLHASGHNVVFLGANGQTVTQLVPVRQFASVMDAKGRVVRHISTAL